MFLRTFRFGEAESGGTSASASNKLWAWGVKSAVSLVDQGLTSGTSLVVNILLACWLSSDQYGAFAVAFAAYLFLALFHNALVLEPSIVIGPAQHSHELGAYFRVQIRLHALLVWPLTGVALIGGLLLSWIAPHSALIGALLGGGLALPLLLLLWLARRMCYVLHNPALAGKGSSIYLAISLGSVIGLRMAGRLTPSTAFFALGLGSLAGACFILRRTALSESAGSDNSLLSWHAILSENWRYGRWLVGGAVFYAVSTSVQTFLAASILGLGSAGALRAMQIPSLMMTQIVASFGLLILPSLAFDFGSGQIASLQRKARWISLGLGFVALIFAGSFVLLDVPLERLLFHGRYANFAQIIPLLALIPAANSFCAGFSLALRACQMPHCDLIANAFGAFVALASAVFLIPMWGVFGAAVSMVLSVIAMSMVTVILYLHSRKRLSAATALPADQSARERIDFSQTGCRSPQNAVQDYV
ncbi:MAG: lipopolysaccharide biosynthesis protein [Candidatus Acidiferrales bacterium]